MELLLKNRWVILQSVPKPETKLAIEAGFRKSGNSWNFKVNEFMQTLILDILCSWRRNRSGALHQQ